MATVTRQSAGVTFDLRTDPPLKEFQFRVSRFTKGIEDWGGALRAYGELFKRQMGEQFETQGSASGSRWAANEPAYAAWKALHFIHSHKVGVLTGALRSSMTGGGGYSEKITKTEGSYGMSDNSPALPYGAIFSAKRPVIRMTAKWGTQYQRVTHLWLVAEERASMGIGGSGVASAVRLGGTPGNLQNVDLRTP
jgi:hypothetical protein